MKIRRIIGTVLAVIFITACLPSLSAHAGSHYEWHYSEGDDFVNIWETYVLTYGGTLVLYADAEIGNVSQNSGLFEKGGLLVDQEGKDITIDLNGHVLRATGDKMTYVFWIEDGCSLTVKDSSEDGSGLITISENCVGLDRIFEVEGTLILDSGTLAGNYRIARCAAVGMDDEYITDTKGTFIMNGGTIRGFNVDPTWSQGFMTDRMNYRSVVNIQDHSSFVMNGGTICGNYVWGLGGAVYLNNESTFTMNGGKISDNVCYEYGTKVLVDGNGGRGGAIFAEDECILNIYQGEISGNYAKNYGGAIFVTDSSECNIDAGMNGMLIKDNSALIGGAVCVHYASTLRIDHAELTGNSAGRADTAGDGYGGAVYISDITDSFDEPDTKVYIDECIIDGNSADFGGAIYVLAGELSIKDTEIKGNSSDKGGGIFIGGEANNDVVLCGDTLITENTALTAGGGVYMESDEGNAERYSSTLELGGQLKIAGNSAIKNGTASEDDLYIDRPDFNTVKIMHDGTFDPLEYSEYGHAWIGVGGEAGVNDIHVMQAGNEKSAAFFGNGIQPGVYNGNFLIFGDLPDMTTIEVIPEKIKDTAGEIIPSDKYEAVLDLVNDTLTITTSEDIKPDTYADFVRPVYGEGAYEKSAMAGIYAETTDSKGNSVYTYRYTVRSECVSGENFVRDNIKNVKMVREVHWKVVIVKLNDCAAKVGFDFYTDVNEAVEASLESGYPVKLLRDAIIEMPSRDTVITADIIDNGFTLTPVYDDGQGNVITGIVTEGATETERIISIPYIYAQSVSTSGEMIVNFYVRLHSSVDTSLYGLRIITSGQEPSDTFAAASSDRKVTVDGIELYRFSVSVPAKEMGDTVTASLIRTDSEETVETKEYSVEEYYYSRLEKSSNQAMRDLAAAALNYGTAAQIYFGWNEEHYVNAGLEDYTEKYVPLDAPETAPSEWNVNVTDGTVEGISFYAQSVMFKGMTAVRFYLECEEGFDPGQVTFLYEDITSDPGTLHDVSVKYSETHGMYYVEITNISAKNIMDVFRVTASLNGQSSSKTYSISTYMYNKYRNNDGLGDLVRAMYSYCMAAREWAAQR